MHATSSWGLTLIAGLALAGAGSVPAAAQQATRTSDVITPEEIERVQVEDAYQVVLRLRPEFLQRAERPQGTARGPGGALGDGRVQGAFAPGSRRAAANPYSPEFDQGGTSGGGGDRSGGFDSPTLPPSQPNRTMPAPSATGSSSVVVFVGNTLMGGVEQLTTLAAASVKEIRYLRPSEAQFRFGPQTGGAAAIVVTLKE